MRNKVYNKLIWIRKRVMTRICAEFAYLKIKKSDKPNIILIGTPQHGNLGDQAISFAERNFLKENFGNMNIVEIQFSEVDYIIEKLKRIVKDSDIIMLHGGGNLGIEYLVEEELRRKVIKNFINNQITLFPQTIYFGDSEMGKIEFEKTKSIYSCHMNLTLIAREKLSFEIMKKSFINNKVILTPDIVLYLNQSKSKPQKRDKVLLCFRNDVESILDGNIKSEIISRLSPMHKVMITDTVVDHSINKKDREKELEYIWSSFRKSKLVITDRLHGMVFAAITSTPCIVFSNYNHKVKYTYNWIKHLPYVKFVEKKEDVFVYINELLELSDKECMYENEFLTTYYNQIIECINENNRDEGPLTKSMSS